MPAPIGSYRQDLGDGLVMASAAGPSDVERLTAFNAVVHEAGVGQMNRVWMLEHPSVCFGQWLYVEDATTGQIASSLCLFPWTLRYEGVELRAAEMSLVGTVKAYRRRGLVRALNSRFEAMSREGEYDLSMIQGIPYFYRQFGYEYAMPLEAQWQIDPYRIPEGAGKGYSVRLATLEDLPALTRMYNDAAGELSICALREEAIWYYLFGPSQRTDMAAETWLVSDAAGQPAGYYRITCKGFGAGLIVSEVSRLGDAAALSTLGHLKQLAIARDKPAIRLNLPTVSPLVRLAQSYGARDEGTYAWQVRLVDVTAFLTKLAPILERRIGSGSFADLDQTVIVNLYREAFGLRFEHGKLMLVESLGFREGGDLRLPPPLIAPLLLGYRSWRELASAYHDVLVAKAARSLADTLFPVTSSFIYTIY